MNEVIKLIAIFGKVMRITLSVHGEKGVTLSEQKALNTQERAALYWRFL